MMGVGWRGKQKHPRSASARQNIIIIDIISVHARLLGIDLLVKCIDVLLHFQIHLQKLAG